MAGEARGFGALSIAAVLAVVLAAAPSALAARSGHGATPRHGKPAEPSDQQSVVQAWARSLGKDLTDMARTVTRFDRLQESIKKLSVEAKDPERTLNEVARNMEKLLQRRANQVQRIRLAAERVGRMGLRDRDGQFDMPQFYPGVKDSATVEILKAKGVSTTPEPSTTAVPPPTKGIMSVLCPAICGDDEEETQTWSATLEPTTTPKPWLVDVAGFPGNSPVNVSLSAVHVPAYVDDGSTINPSDPENYPLELNSTGADVQRVIELTEDLDETFRSNMKEDWTTSWQFFAHHSGVMRQYPASKWNRKFADDYFDARLRPWYLRAASSPKDIVILLDNSGSIHMTEPNVMTKVLAHTVLESLTPDDFVTVLVYNDTVLPLLPGLKDTLIPATSANVRELQFAMAHLTHNGTGNLSIALEYSFKLLERYRRESVGASCNQAIILITDLVYMERPVELFRAYNGLGPDNPKQSHVRVFTFVVGDGNADMQDAQWTACANKGWHEKFWKTSSPIPTLKYVQIMARPMVLRGEHPVHWSPMYADITVPGLTDQLWIAMQGDEQRRRITPYCFHHEEMHHGRHRHQVHVRPPIVDGDLGQSEEFVVTVSVPVHNLSAAGLAEGALLGVAGIDVPVSQLTAFITPHKVGVNAYIFMVNNNGLVVFHPDMRPKFNGILKPGFNSLDMSEVEQEDTPNPRDLSQAMQNFRAQVVNQNKGSVVLTVRHSYRNWRRVARQARRYYFQGVDKTPYSLVLATPLEYGAEGIKASHDSSLTSGKLLGLLGAERSAHAGWQVHPNWVYCGCCGQPGRQGLDSLSLRGHCDRELANALAGDADATRFYAEKVKDASAWDRWDVHAAFVATHSGLTRWAVRPLNIPVEMAPQRPPVTPRGPDEPWFKRAVSLAWAAAASESDAKAGQRGAPQPGAAPHWVITVPMQDEEDADVYSEYNAAYDADDPWAARRAGLADSWNSEDKPNVTEDERADYFGVRVMSLTAALFRGRAPAAVAGVNFPVHALQEVFVKTTTRPDILSCSSEELDCYLLDENAIVVADKTGTNVGRPLALVNNDLTARLEAAHVFERVTLHDVQGVCRRAPSAAVALTPSLGSSLFGTAALAVLWWTGVAAPPADVAHAVHPAHLYTAATAAALLNAVGKARAAPAPGKKAPRQFLVTKTVLQPCDMKMHLHRVARAPSLHLHHRSPPIQLGCGADNGTRSGDRTFMLAAVPGTNLILVVALNVCPEVEQADPFRAQPWEDAVPKGSPVFRKVGPQWPRRRPDDCFCQHDAEPKCGDECKAFCGGEQ